MIRIVLVLLLIAIVIYGLNAVKKAAPEKSAYFIRLLFYTLVGLSFLFLAASGHLNGIFALIGVFAAFAVRMLPQLIRYAPYLHRLWQEFLAAKQQQSSGRQSGRTNPKSSMTKTEAYEILGLKPGASEQDVITAHRKLMQKIHPDRGGSNYLAAQINLAKKTLLGK